MSVVATFSCQPGLAAFWSADLQCRGVALPWGGPLDSGGEYAQLSALTLVAAAPAHETWVITASGSGTFAPQFTGGYGTQVSTLPLTAATATAAQVLASLQTIFPDWMLPAGSVTGSAGGPWTVTFGGNYRVGGFLQFVTRSGTGSATLVRSQRGSVGAGQYELYNGTTFTTVNALLKGGLNLGVSGGLSTQPYGPLDDETWPATAYIGGYFFWHSPVDNTTQNIPNVTTAAVAGARPGLSWHVGSASALGGAIVHLIQ